MEGDEGFQGRGNPRGIVIGRWSGMAEMGDQKDLLVRLAGDGSGDYLKGPLHKLSIYCGMEADAPSPDSLA
jgi:hypothetical protein